MRLVHLAASLALHINLHFKILSLPHQASPTMAAMHFLLLHYSHSDETCTTQAYYDSIHALLPPLFTWLKTTYPLVLQNFSSAFTSSDATSLAWCFFWPPTSPGLLSTTAQIILCGHCLHFSHSHYTKDLESRDPIGQSTDMG